MKARPSRHARPAALAAALALSAVPTVLAAPAKIWMTSTQKDLLDGEGDAVRLGPQGELSLGLRADERASLDEPVVWAVAPGRDGSAWVGTGSSGRLLRVSATGEVVEAARFEELQVTALLPDGDSVLAATSPQGAIYRVRAGATSSEKPEEVARPEAQYIWALARGSDGTIYAGTGVEGSVFAIREGGVKLFATTYDVHVVSLLALPDGGLIAGTAERGLVLRIAPDGTVRVLHDSSYREARALALTESGAILAAINGGSSFRDAREPPRQSEASVTVTAEPAEPPPGGASAPPPPPPPPSLSLPPPEALVEQSAEVVRIERDGASDVVARVRGEIVYALANAPWGETVLGTSKRLVVPISGDELAAVLLRPGPGSAGAGQVSAIVRAGSGLLIATSGPSRLFAVGGERAREGSYTSKVFAADTESTFGALRGEIDLPAGASVRFETRSGGTLEPDPTWAPWTEAAPDGHGGVRVASPAARFLQWRVKLRASDPAHGPRLRSIAVAFQPRNQRPVIRSFSAQPPGVLFQKGMPLQAVVESAPPPLPSMFEELGAAKSEPSAASKRLYRRGSETLAWDVADPNDDELVVKLWIRSRAGGPLLPLRERPEGNSFTFDAEALPDGWWIGRIEVDDSPANPQGALSATRDSEPFLVDNTPPRVTVVSSRREGKRARVRVEASDALSPLWKAEWAIDGGSFMPLFPDDGITDNLVESFEVMTGELAPGEHLVVVRVTDLANQSAAARVTVGTDDERRRTRSDD